MPPNEVQEQAASPTAGLDIARVRALCGAQRLAHRFHYFEKIGSTNTHARALAEAGAREGEIVIAEAQTEGRGRLGRRWESPPFTNLYFSVILRPGLPARHAPQITLAAAVALADAAGAFLPSPPAIKWPNDILVDGKKLAGILTEAACSSGRVEYVVLGIGLNVNYRLETMPETLRQRATSLAGLTGKNLSRESVLARLIHDLDRCYGDLEEAGFKALRQRWEERFGWRGRRVRVDLGDDAIFGTALSIDRDGALILQDDDGRRRTIVAGDVIPLES
jgi:BirA family biotin operon repressor/biotin-[acetyl-CoA-carboxylase] ligase